MELVTLLLRLVYAITRSLFVIMGKNTIIVLEDLTAAKSDSFEERSFSTM